MGDLSPHFDVREFRCKHCGAVKVTAELVALLERLRSIVAAPLIVVSGYRCPTHNGRVGGASNSYHLRGMAADLRVGYATVGQALDAGATGVGTKGPYAVHVDVRPGKPVIFRD